MRFGLRTIECLMPLSTIFQLYRGRSVLLVEETGVPTETMEGPAASEANR